MWKRYGHGRASRGSSIQGWQGLAVFKGVFKKIEQNRNILGRMSFHHELENWITATLFRISKTVIIFKA